MPTQTASDHRLLPHTPRQLAGQRTLLARQLQLLEQRPRSAVEVLDLVQPGNQAQLRVDRQILEEVWLVGHECQVTLGGYGGGHDIVTIDGHPSRSWPQYAS